MYSNVESVMYDLGIRKCFKSTILFQGNQNLPHTPRIPIHLQMHINVDFSLESMVELQKRNYLSNQIIK